MDDYDPYDDGDFTQMELVEMAMGNAVGEPGVSMKEIEFQLTKVQADLLSRALSQYNEYETESEQEVAQRTERLIREKFDLS